MQAKAFMKSVNLAPTYISFVQSFPPFFCHKKKAMLCAKPFTEHILPFGEYMIYVLIHLTVQAR